MSTNETLPARQQSLNTLSALLQQMKPQLRMALPKHLTPERFIRVALTAWHKTPALQDCSPMSILGAIVQAAQLGLEPDSVLGHCYLVPFRNRQTGQQEAQLITGYKGLLELARRSGCIKAIDSRVVYARDRFAYRLGLDPSLEHVPSDDEDRGQLTHAWAIAHFADGGYQMEVMTRAEIEKIRRQSKAADKGPWVTHYEEMSRKTVLRRLAKFLPLSPEIQRQISAEEHADAGLIESQIVEGVAPPALLVNDQRDLSGSRSDALVNLLQTPSQPATDSEPEPQVEQTTAREPGDDSALEEPQDQPADDTTLKLDLLAEIRGKLQDANSEQEFGAAASMITRNERTLGECHAAVLDTYRQRYDAWKTTQRSAPAKTVGNSLAERAGLGGSRRPRASDM